MSLCKTSDPRSGTIFDPQGYNLNKFGRGSQDEAIYQNIKDLSLLVIGKKIFKSFQLKSVFTYCDVDVTWTGTI